MPLMIFLITNFLILVDICGFCRETLGKVSIQLVNIASSLSLVNIVNESNICVRSFQLLVDDIFDGKWLLTNVCDKARSEFQDFYHQLSVTIK